MKQTAVISLTERVILRANPTTDVQGLRILWDTPEGMRAICTDEQLELRPITHGTFVVRANAYMGDNRIATRETAVIVLPTTTLDISVEITPYEPAPINTVQALSIDSFAPGQMG
jgi:hypothetical protein